MPVYYPYVQAYTLGHIQNSYVLKPNYTHKLNSHTDNNCITLFFLILIFGISLSFASKIKYNGINNLK